MHRNLSLVLVSLAIVALPTAASAQEGGDPRRVFATRATLESQAQAAEQIAAATDSPAALRETKRAEAWILRYRLERGDFVVGDRIALVAHGDSTLSDTVVVNADRAVLLRGMPPISLDGVLRSELETHLSTVLAKYLRNSHVEAIPLVRITVSGEVSDPGFYDVRADLLLSDVVMLAGGPTAAADLQRSLLRRSGDVLFDESDVRIALSDGMSLDQLNLRGGDELRVGERRRLTWTQALQGVGAIAGVAGLLLSLGSR